MRSFEFAERIDEMTGAKVPGEKMFKEAQLPEYQTKYAAGADFFCAERVIIPSIWTQVLRSIRWCVGKRHSLSLRKRVRDIKPTMVHTGVKANMSDDEVLVISNRSSGPLKRGLVLSNGIGVIDRDYYGNSKNDGEIMFAFYNFRLHDVTVEAGERIGQGMFQKVLRPEKGLRVKDDVREGGFGHTGV